MATSSNAKSGSGMAPLPFDKHSSIDSFALRDHFLSTRALAAITTSGVLLSDLAWTVTDVAGAATADVEVLASVANHPGIIRLNVGATTPADGDIVSMTLTNQDALILSDDSIYCATLLRVPDVSDSIVEFGLTAIPAAPNSSAADVVSFVFDPEDADNVGDAFWFAQVNDGGVDLEVVLDGVSYVENDWVLLEISATDTGAYFRITTEDATQTAYISGTVTVGLTPTYIVENVGAAEEFIEIDSFVLRGLVAEKIDNLLGA